MNKKEEELEMLKIDLQDHPEKTSIKPQEEQKPLKGKDAPLPVKNTSTGVVGAITKPKKPLNITKNSSAVKLDDFRAKSLLSFGFNKFQIETIYSQTPDKFVKNRKGRGGKNFDYIPVYITIKYLNLVFGLGWDFEITKEEIMWEQKQVLVKGKLTAHLPSGNKIIKEQYASKEIQYYSDKPDNYGKIHPRANEVISIGDDLKGAASLCLTKCASYLGLFSDIYSNEYYAKYEMPDGIEEGVEIDKEKLFNDALNLIKLVSDGTQKEKAINRAVESNQFTKEQNEELNNLKIKDESQQKK